MGFFSLINFVLYYNILVAYKSFRILKYYLVCLFLMFVVSYPDISFNLLKQFYF